MSSADLLLIAVGIVIAILFYFLIQAVCKAVPAAIAAVKARIGGWTRSGKIDLATLRGDVAEAHAKAHEVEDTLKGFGERLAALEAKVGV